MMSGDSSEDEELRWMVVLQQKGFTLIRAVLLMGRGGELIVDFVIFNYGDLKDKF